MAKPTTTAHKAQADALVAAVRSRGSDATDARDAAHEAAHALTWSVTKKWTRNNIHAKKPRIRADGVYDELTARAVEAIVCERLGIEHDVKHWAFVMVMEMAKNEKISLPSIDWAAEGIELRMKTRMAQELADEVMTLGAK
jgi:hypothetical protein